MVKQIPHNFSLSIVRVKWNIYLYVYFRYKNLKNGYLAKSPFEKWDTIRKINIFLLRLYGTHFMAPNFKLGLTSLIPIFLELHNTSLTIYTIIYYRHESNGGFGTDTCFGADDSCNLLQLHISSKNILFQLYSSFALAFIFIHSCNDSIVS